MKENLPNAYRPLKSTETSVHLHGDTKRKDIVSSGLKPSEEEYYERVPELKKKKKKKKKKIFWFDLLSLFLHMSR